MARPMSEAMFVRMVVVVVMLLQDVTSFPMYQRRIPNGASVPFPCRSGQIWNGVGHIQHLGGGPRNPFGLDFAAARYQWTEDLCRKDSDGDGRSNGAELGDPDCVWNTTATSTSVPATSHPGICDPWNSHACAHKPLPGWKYKLQVEWMADMCKSEGFDCPVLAEAGVRNLTVRLLPAYSLPASPTIYRCKIFDLHELGLPEDQDFHLIAVQPIIDNKNLIHHMVLSGCTSDTATTEEPFNCPMKPSPNCNQHIHVWTVGLNGECFNPQVGIRIGKNGFKRIAIQTHWNNPLRLHEETDSSGLLLHYTPNLRTYDAGMFVVGAEDFVLPPQKSEVIVRSTCASGCTREGMTGPINVISAGNHMHYTGRKMTIQLMRNTTIITNITDDQEFVFEKPQWHYLDPPLEVRPGDALITSCHFDTSDRNRSTIFGSSNSDEMCYGFVMYFPKQNMKASNCVDTMGISECNEPSLEGCTNLNSFLRAINTTAVFREVRDACQRFSPCLKECQDTIVKFMRDEKCMQGKVWHLIQTKLAADSAGREFLSLLSSCKIEVFLALNPLKK